MPITAKETWRDYETDGVPSSGAHKPSKSQIRTWGTYLEQVQGTFSSVTAFDAATTATSAANLTAFLAAITYANGGPVYVPGGTFKLTTPLALPYTARFYGPGVLQFDNAEWIRRGGSSGSIAVPENYTLFFNYSSQSDVSVQFNGVTQTITWVDDFTVQAPGSLITDSVRVNIVNGTMRLGSVPVMVRSWNTIDVSAPNLAPSLPDAVTTPVGYDNWFVGVQSPVALTTGINNTFGGSRAGRSLKTGDNNTALGFQALYRANSHGNTAVGSVCLEWLTTGSQNTSVGALSSGKLTTGTFNSALGYQAFEENESGDFNVAVGHRALANPFDGDANECVAVGAFALDLTYGDKNVGIGYRAGCGNSPDGSDGNENVFVGWFAGRNQMGADYNVGVGLNALVAMTSAQQNVAVGHSALASVTTVGAQVAVGYQALTANTTGTGNTAVGQQAMAANVSGVSNVAVGSGALQASTSSENVAVGFGAGTALTSGAGLTAVGFEAGRFIVTASNGTFIGHRAGRSTTGADNTSLGHDALQFNTTGIQNTALGRAALRVDQAAANQTNYDNTTGVGYDARVSGSNQVQIGNSATTTYVYGTVQNRSDARDKADIRDTELGLDFIMALRPVDFRWDMREDYVEVTDDGEVIRHEKDGSRKRNRYHHGFVAQEIAESGFEFGGLQDHSINGGNDVLSLGHDELFGPLVKAVQTLKAANDNLEARIEALEAA